MLTTEEWAIVAFSVFVIAIRLAYFLHQRFLSKPSPALLRAQATDDDECAGVLLLSWRPLENWDAPEPDGPLAAEPEEEHFGPPSYSSLQLGLPPPYQKDGLPTESDFQDGAPPSYSEICFAQQHQPQHQYTAVSEPPPHAPPPYPSPAAVALPSYPSPAAVALPCPQTLGHIEVTRL